MNRSTLRSIALVAAAAVALSAAAASAHDLSFNAGVTTDYVARGSTQSNHQPSYSVGADLSLDNGFYVGAWTANVDFLDGTDQEVDLTAGYRTSFKSFNIEYGVAAYNYEGDPGRGLDMEEAHVTVLRDFGKFGTSVTAAYSPNYFNMGTRSVWYEGKVTYPLTSKLTVDGAIGYQTVDRKTIFPPYATYNVGLSYALTKNLSTGLRYTASNLDKAAVGVFADDAISLSLSTSF